MLSHMPSWYARLSGYDNKTLQITGCAQKVTVPISNVISNLLKGLDDRPKGVGSGPGFPYYKDTQKIAVNDDDTNDYSDRLKN